MSSVFIVAKSVINWFEASRHNATATETIKEEANQVGTGIDIAGQSRPAHTTILQVEVNPHFVTVDS